MTHVAQKPHDNVGVKTVTIAGTGASAWCTALLGVTLTGEKLPPIIIFKGMPNGRVAQKVSPTLSARCTRTLGWMNQRFCTGRSPFGISFL